MVAPFFVWLVLAVLFALFEIGHPGLFFFLSFSIGAVLAAVGSLSSVCLATQLTIFFVGTVLAFLFLKRFVSRLVDTSGQRTNVEALVGKKGMVLEVITSSIPGRVRVGSEVWLARTSAGIEIAEGAQVTVVAVRGAHLVVCLLDKDAA